MFLGALLPGVHDGAVSPSRILAELSAPELEMEQEDGWLAQELARGERGATGLRDELRRFRRFIGWIDLSLTLWGLEEAQVKMPVRACKPKHVYIRQMVA